MAESLSPELPKWSLSRAPEFMKYGVPVPAVIGCESADGTPGFCRIQVVPRSFFALSRDA